MVSVRVNGSEFGIGTASVTKFTELVELIKASIDPEHMITNIMLDGRDLSDDEWAGNLSQFGTAIIEVETDTPENFVNSRLSAASRVVRTCYLEFREARKCFQSGDMANGNQTLIKAVNTARAFFEWYASLMNLVPDDKRQRYDMTKQVEEISEICKRICQQQLYQSWWALGETLEKELEPKLDKLEDFCRSFVCQA